MIIRPGGMTANPGPASWRILNAGGGTTWNPSDKTGNVTLSSGNLVATWNDAGSNPFGVRATVPIGTGKYYFEIACGDNLSAIRGVGLIKSTANIASPSANLSDNVDAVTARSQSGWVVLAGAAVGNYGNTSTKGASHYFRVAVDGTAKKIWFVSFDDSAWCAGDANLWRGAAGGSVGDPAAGTNGLDFSSLTGTLYPFCFGATNGQVFTARFKSSSWVRSAPSGFGELT